MTAQKTATSFTPGPWRVSPDSPYRVERDPLGAPFGTLDPAKHIAVIVGNSTAWRAETEATARLIAAAPSLYEALLDCLGDLEHYASTHGPGPDRRLEQAREAIRLVGRGEV